MQCGVHHICYGDFCLNLPAGKGYNCMSSNKTIWTLLFNQSLHDGNKHGPFNIAQCIMHHFTGASKCITDYPTKKTLNVPIIHMGITSVQWYAWHQQRTCPVS